MKRPAESDVGHGNGKLPRRLQTAAPRQTFEEIKAAAYDGCGYNVDRSVRYEEEHPASDAVLIPTFVHLNTAALGKGASANPTSQEFLWRHTPGLDPRRMPGIYQIVALDQNLVHLLDVATSGLTTGAIGPLRRILDLSNRVMFVPGLLSSHVPELPFFCSLTLSWHVLPVTLSRQECVGLRCTSSGQKLLLCCRISAQPYSCLHEALP
jgi:hypothetical protein